MAPSGMQSGGAGGRGESAYCYKFCIKVTREKNGRLQHIHLGGYVALAYCYVLILSKHIVFTCIHRTSYTSVCTRSFQSVQVWPPVFHTVWFAHQEARVCPPTALQFSKQRPLPLTFDLQQNLHQDSGNSPLKPQKRIIALKIQRKGGTSACWPPVNANPPF